MRATKKKVKEVDPLKTTLKGVKEQVRSSFHDFASSKHDIFLMPTLLLPDNMWDQICKWIDGSLTMKETSAKEETWILTEKWGLSKENQELLTKGLQRILHSISQLKIIHRVLFVFFCCNEQTTTTLPFFATAIKYRLSR